VGVCVCVCVVSSFTTSPIFLLYTIRDFLRSSETSEEEPEKRGMRRGGGMALVQLAEDDRF